MDFLERLKSLWPDNAKPADFYNKIDMSASGFSRVWKDGAIPTADYLIKIQEVTGCDLNWLLTGKGQPYLSDNFQQATPTAQHGSPSHDVLGRQVDTSRFAFIPFYQDIQASAGYGFENNNETYEFCLAFRKDFLEQNISTSVSSLSVITVKGNSMEGLLQHGDLILVNHARNDPADGLYVLKIGSDLFVKLIQRLPEKRLLVKSTSPKYEPFEIDLNKEDADITIIGKVEWLGRSML